MKKRLREIVSCLMAAVLLCGQTGVLAAEEKTLTLAEKRQRVLEEFSYFDIVRMSDLDPDDPNFWIEIRDNSKPTLPGYDPAVDLPDPYYNAASRRISEPAVLLPRTTSNTTYKVYNSSGVAKYNGTTYTNLFQAINLANNTGDYVEESDTTEKAFIRDNNASTYFRYQFTNFFNDTNAQSYSPAEWTHAYRYAHVVNGKGHLISNSFYLIDGIAPPAYALEPESGSYYYKISNGWSADSCSGTANFNGVTYHISSSNNNLYVFTAAQTTTSTIEIGIMTARARNGAWCVYFRDSTVTDPSGIKVMTNQVALSPTTSDTNNHIYSISSGTVPIKLSLTSTDGQLTGRVGSYQMTLYGDSTFSTNSNCTFIQAVSMPEPLAVNQNTGETINTANLRCGSYFRSMKLINCRLYSGVNYSGTSYNFYPDNSTIINTAFIYCDDTITYNRSGADAETISIDYSIGYNS